MAKINKAMEVELGASDLSYCFCQLPEKGVEYFFLSLVEEGYLSEETAQAAIKDCKNLISSHPHDSNQEG